MRNKQVQQLQVALHAVEEGVLDSGLALRAVVEWLSEDSEMLCEVLLRQPDITEELRQSLQDRFSHEPLTATKTPSAASGPAASNVRVDDMQLDRLKELLNQTDDWSDDEHADSGTPANDHLPPAVAGKRWKDKTEPYEPHVGQPDRAPVPLETLGQFQIEREFARGGLGILYLASDRQLRRQVIIKKIQPSRARSRATRSKFLLEAEVTGQLEHPGIVPVYAFGSDAKREPYYAMRLIDGQHLGDAIAKLHAQRKVTIRFFESVPFREMLQQFIDVCYAMEYAHSRGIIHRDLKPANVMLGKHGQTLVVDWGLAKLYSREVVPSSDAPPQLPELPPVELSHVIDRSVEGDFGGTMRYAPPEQLAGQIGQLCPASDVYSLGAILFEILCNQPALAGKYGHPAETLMAIETGTLRAPRHVIQQVPRPLNAICVKALAPCVTDRYSSALELAKDVQRYLADEPVLAYKNQESRIEKFGRWLRHHRSWAAAMALSLVGLTIFALVANYFINQARLNELSAKRQAIEFKSDAVTRYRVAKSSLDALVDRGDILQDFSGAGAIRAQLLQQAASGYAALSETESTDPELEIERARAMVRLADTLALQGKKAEAMQQYDQVARMLESAILESPGDSDAKSQVENSLDRRIELGRTYSRRATAQYILGKSTEARKDFHQAISLFEGLLLEQPNANAVSGNLAIAFYNLAVLEATNGKRTVAQSLAEKNLQLYANLEWPQPSIFVLNQARCHALLASLYRHSNRAADVARQLKLVDLCLSPLLEREPDNPQYAEVQAGLWVSTASESRTQGDYAGAIQALTKSLLTYEQLQQRWPESVNYDLGAAVSQSNLALVYAELQEWATGQSHLNEAERLFQSIEHELNAERHATLVADFLDTDGVYGMAANLRSKHQLAEVAKRFEKAIALVEPLLTRTGGSQDELAHYEQLIARYRSHLGQCYAQADDWENARSQFTSATSQLEKILKDRADNSLPTGEIQSQLAHSYWHWAEQEHRAGQFDAAKKYLERCVDLWNHVVRQDPSPKNHFELGKCLMNCPARELRSVPQAIEHFEFCVNALPDNSEFLKAMEQAKGMQEQ